MPAGAVHEDGGMGAGGDVAADLLEVQLHRRGIRLGQHEGGALAAPRADRPEQIGDLVALVGGQARAASLARPDADTAVLLAEPGRSDEHPAELQSIMRISYAVV